jgi:uncharacterized membrane protein
MQRLCKAIGAAIVVALTLAAGAETFGQQGNIRNQSDRDICRDALNPGRIAWDQNPNFSIYVTEANRRGLTVNGCRELLGLQSLSVPTYVPRTNPPPATRVSETLEALGYLVVGLVLIAFPFASIIALVMILGTRRQVQQLHGRIAAIEAVLSPRVRAQPASVPKTPERRRAEVSKPLAEKARPTIRADVEQRVLEEGIRKAWEDAAKEIGRPGTTSEPTPIPAATTPPAVPTLEDTLEKRFGTKWAVWIGGLALALGAIFLVRYSIEMIGPAIRIVLGAIFSVLLIAVGEWSRRKELAAGIPVMRTRHIPSILTAAGTIAAYATTYAAFALYGFLSPLGAFIVLGLVSLATLAAALLHGPMLAGLGLAGAFVTPALVPSETPDYWALYIYLAAVNAAAFALAGLRLWRWLAITAVVLGALWTLLGIQYPHVDALAAHLFHVVAGFVLASTLIVSGLMFGPDAESGRVEGISSGAIGAYLLAATALVIGSDHDTAALVVFAILTSATVAIGWRASSALWALPGAGLMSLLVMLHWAMPVLTEQLVMAAGVTRGAIPGPPTGVAPHLTFGLALIVLFGASGFAAQRRPGNPLVAFIWSLTAVITPLAILTALYMRITEFDRSIPFAGLALLLAALYGYATELLSNGHPRPGGAARGAIFAAGAVGSLALALTFALEKGWLTIALALMVLGIAWVSERRPLPALRYLSAAMIVLVLLRVGYEPRIVGDDVGTTPIFNWLLYGYGVPAGSFWYAGYLLRRRIDDGPARIADAAAILFTVLLVMLEIRHYVNDGDLYRSSSSLGEIAMQISAALAITIGLEYLRLSSNSIVHNLGASVIGWATLALIASRLGIAFNPLFTGRPVGGAFFNLVLLGYGAPAVLTAILALVTRKSGRILYPTVAAMFAVGLSVFYLSFEIRTLYHGPILTSGVTTDAEQYTYSAVWLIFGVVLLGVGFLLRSQPARLASAAVVTLTIAKVFLIDMAGLTGILRALSFIGLGVVLIGIGWFYQRILFPTNASHARPSATDAV